MKSKSRPKITKSAFAELLGITRQALACHTRKPDAPPIGDLEAWQVYLAAHGRIGSVPEELRRAIAQQRLEILKQTKIKLARENEVEAGKLMLVADAVRHANTAGAFFMGELERLTREGPPAWAGQSAAEIATHLDGLVERIRRELQAKMQAIA